MVRYLLVFLWHTVIERFLSGYYREELIWSSDHPHYRRYFSEYKEKKRKVKMLWLVTGSIGVVVPILPVLSVLCLFSMFLSFGVLDEAP